MESERLATTIRPITADEHGFVYANLARSTPYAAGCSAPALYAGIYRCARTLLDTTTGWTVLVAECTDVPGELAGWIAFRRRPQGVEVAYTYVKLDFRSMGVGRALLAAAGVEPGKPFRCVFARPDVLGALRTAGYWPLLAPFIAFELLALEPMQ